MHSGCSNELRLASSAGEMHRNGAKKTMARPAVVSKCSSMNKLKIADKIFVQYDSNMNQKNPLAEKD